MSGANFSGRYSIVAEARRQWSEAEKQAVVAEAERPGVNISAVARRHGIKPSLLFRWRRLARDAQDQPSTAFIPVTLALPAAETSAQDVAAEADASPVSPPPAASREPAEQRIEIALGNGRVVRVGAGVDVDSLRRILDAADGR
jgi:transposase